jgi:predicted nucleotidyltransferase
MKEKNRDHSDDTERCSHGILTAECEKCKREAISQDAKKDLLDTLQRTQTCEGEDLVQVEEARSEIKAALEQFPKLLESFASTYRHELESAGIRFNDLKIYMVGGRVRGTPLKASSDIDLLFVFDRPIFPYGDKGTTLDTKDWIALRTKVLFELFTKICEESGLKNHGGYPGRFQFFNWGGEKSEEQVLNELQGDEVALRVY